MGGPTGRQIKDFVYHLPCNIPTVTFWFSKDSYHFRTSIQKVLESLVILGHSPRKRTEDSLGKVWKNIHKCCISVYISLDPSSKGHSHLPDLRFLICELAYVQDLYKRSWIPTMATQVRFLLIRPRIFSPIYVKQHPRKLSIYLISRDPRDPPLTYSGKNILITVLSLLLTVIIIFTLLWKLNNTTWSLNLHVLIEIRKP